MIKITRNDNNSLTLTISHESLPVTLLCERDPVPYAHRITESGMTHGVINPALARRTRLRALGHEVVNPAELNPDTETPWHQCMRRDLAALLTCDAMAMLDGWQKSAGAHLEMHVAHRIGITILFANEVMS